MTYQSQLCTFVVIVHIVACRPVTLQRRLHFDFDSSRLVITLTDNDFFLLAVGSCSVLI